MSPFAQGAHDAGAVAGRAVFADLKRSWAAVVSELDVLVEGRAALRGISQRTLAEAQSAALDGLSGEFDRLFEAWTSPPDQVANLSTRSVEPTMVPAE